MTSWSCTPTPTPLLDWSLAVCYMETNELLNAFLILLLSWAADHIMTWLSKGSLRLPHLLVHPGQTQSKRRENKRAEEQNTENTSKPEESATFTAGLMINVQRDDVCVGLLHGYTQRLLAIFITVILCGSSFEEQTHLPGKTRGDKQAVGRCPPCWGIWTGNMCTFGEKCFSELNREGK